MWKLLKKLALESPEDPAISLLGSYGLNLNRAPQAHVLNFQCPVFVTVSKALETSGSEVGLDEVSR